MIKHPLYSTLNSHSKVLYNPLNLDGCSLALTKPYIGSDKWIDYSGYGNNGTIHGASKDSNGFLSFDEIDDYVEFEDNKSLKLVDDITIDTRIKPLSLMSSDGIEGIIQKYSINGGYMLSFPYSASSKISFILRHNTDTVNITSSYALELNKWWRITCTFKKPNLKLYINGILNTVGTFNYQLTDSLTNLKMGYYLRYIKGIIGNTYIIHKALTPTEILYNTIYPY